MSAISKDELVDIIIKKLKNKPTPLIITIGGASGSGKTTLAEYLKARFDNIATISTDDYYIGKVRMRLELPPELASNFDHPCAVDIQQIAQHVEKLKNCQTIQKPTYNILKSEPGGTREKIMSAPLIVVEGIVANQPSITSHADIRIATFIDAEKRVARRVARDIVRKDKTPEQTMQYIASIAEPAYLTYYYDNDKQADYIVDPTK